MFVASSRSDDQVSGMDEAEELRSEARRLQSLAEKLETRAAELEQFRNIGESTGAGRAVGL